VTRSQQAGAALVALVIATAAAAPVLTTNPPWRQHAGMAFAPPMPPRIVQDGGISRPFVYPLRLTNRLDRTYVTEADRPVPIAFFTSGRLASTEGTTWLPLGADPLGRDVFARLLDGGRRSLGVAGMAVLLTLAIGALAGAAAGYAGGTLDTLISSVSDFVLVLPVLYAIVTLRAAMPLVLDEATIFWTMVVVMALASWPMPARGVRAIVATERRKGYAEAAYAAGAGPLRILLRHVLPAAAGHIAIQGLLLFPAFIFGEATLSYLGLGFADPSSSWGLMLKDAGGISAMTEAPWLLAPAVAIVITVLGVHLLTAEEGSVVR
jgi:peptide/nickel transport system permease protein